MYKEIFKSGVNDKSLAAAGEYAKEVVKSKLESITQRSIDFIDSKRQYETIKAGGWLNPKFMDMFDPIIHPNTNESIPQQYFRKAHEIFPIKKDSYDGVKAPVNYLMDEMCHWPDPSFIEFHKALGIQSCREGIDLNNKESKGSLASNCDKMLEDLWLKELTKNKKK